MPPKTSSSIDKAWADSFQQALTHEKKPQGDGWKTAKQLIADYDIGKNRAMRALNKCLEEGKLEQFRGLQYNGKRLQNQVWYRPKEISK